MSIFDEVLADHRSRLSDPFAAAAELPPRPRAPIRPDTQPAPVRSQALTDLHARIDRMEATVMAALDNVTTQLDQLTELVQGRVRTVLDELAQKAANPAAEAVTAEQMADVERRITELRSELDSIVTAAHARGTGQGG